jgi:hypothetical protein
MLPSATSDKAPASPASSALLLLPRSSHWLHRCSHTLGWLLSRSAVDQSIGVPPVELEGQLSVWLRSLLFEGGLPFIQGAKSASGEDSSESLPWEAEEAVLERQCAAAEKHEVCMQNWLRELIVLCCVQIEFLSNFVLQAAIEVERAVALDLVVADGAENAFLLEWLFLNCGLNAFQRRLQVCCPKRMTI